MGRDSTSQPVRLYTKGVVTGFRRNHRNHQPHTVICKVDGVQTKEDAQFYVGKRVAYVYRASRPQKVSSKVETRTGKNQTNYRVIWGRLVAVHGNNGAMRAKFRNNYPAKAFGATIRVMLYPSSI